MRRLKWLIALPVVALLLGAVATVHAKDEWFTLSEKTLKAADPSVEIKSEGGRWKKDVKKVKLSVEGGDVEILGHIFEQSISDLEEMHRQLSSAGALEPDPTGPTKRKKEA